MNSYIELYQQYSEDIKNNSAKIFNSTRDKSFEDFNKNGFPTSKDESYRNSSIVDKLSLDYGININRLRLQIEQEHLYKCKVPNIKAKITFMINDTFFMPKDTELPQGVIFCSISQAEKEYPELLEKYMFRKSSVDGDIMTRFNDSFVQDGFFLYIKKDIEIKDPLQIINVLTAKVPVITFTHNIIILEEGTSAKLLMCNHVMGKQEFFASKVTEIFVGDRANFECYSIENTGRQTCDLSQTFIEQKDNSNVLVNSISLLNATSRNQINADIDGENASIFLGGMLISDGKQESENHTLIRHKKPNSTSNELFKYILDDHSHGIFDGIIIVDKDAQKTASRQTCRSICLSPDAVMQSQPQLEIYADDVKCGHGATTGQLDNDALFYMKQRGIDEKTGKLMLLSAFMQDVIDNVKIEALQISLLSMINSRLRNEPASCLDCSICSS